MEDDDKSKDNKEAAPPADPPAPPPGKKEAAPPADPPAPPEHSPEVKAQLARLKELEQKEKDAEKAKLSEKERLDKEREELAESRFRLDLREAGVPKALGDFLNVPAKDGDKVAASFAKEFEKAVKAEVEKREKERGVGTPRGPLPPKAPKDNKQGDDNNDPKPGKLRSIMDRSAPTGSAARK